MSKAFPLQWPDGWPRTKTPASSQFKTSLPGALKNVQDSIRRFSDDSGKKIDDLVISSNVTLGDQRPQDAGVAVYFSWDGISTCIAVDKYKKVEENLQAIHHCLEAERTKLRHGGLNIVRAAFRGYASLPPPTGREWFDVLECRQDASQEVIKANYQRLRRAAHPDSGGSSERFIEIQKAYNTALSLLGKKGAKP